MNLQTQIVYLFFLAIPIACISWTVTHEEVFREIIEYCKKQSSDRKSVLGRKFFYLFTCEYCFSHYVTLGTLLLTHFTLLYSGWKGYIIAGFSLVWIANIYMSLFAFVRVGLKSERLETKIKEEVLNGDLER